MSNASVYSISAEFIKKYPFEKYPELLWKEFRPYECLLVDSHKGYYICIPFRSNIRHKNAFFFRESERCREKRSGLDYSKVVLVCDKIYLCPGAVVDKDEFNEAQRKLEKITKDIVSYIDTYTAHKLGNSLLSPCAYERKYKYSTLPYFDDILLK